MKLDKLAELIVDEYSKQPIDSEERKGQIRYEIQQILKTMSQNIETHKFYVRIEVEL